MSAYTRPAAISSSCEPSSTTTPPLMTTILSQFRIVLCAQQLSGLAYAQDCHEFVTCIFIGAANFAGYRMPQEHRSYGDLYHLWALLL